MPVDPELLERYDRLIELSIEGRTYRVPENNNLLRALQFLDFDLYPCRLCWNSECDNCHFQYIDPQSQQEVVVRGCETNAFEDMRITRVPPNATWPAPRPDDK